MRVWYVRYKALRGLIRAMQARWGTYKGLKVLVRLLDPYKANQLVARHNEAIRKTLPKSKCESKAYLLDLQAFLLALQKLHIANLHTADKQVSKAIKGFLGPLRLSCSTLKYFLLVPHLAFQAPFNLRLVITSLTMRIWYARYPSLLSATIIPVDIAISLALPSLFRFLPNGGAPLSYST